MSATCLVVNPRSAGGATAARLGELERLAREELGPVRVLATEGPGHATELTSRALAEGFARVIAVGGDGTANEVVNGFFAGDRPLAPAASFALVHAGTGGDLVKTLRVPRDPREAFRAIARHEPLPTDVLHHTFVDHAGARVERLGINVTGFGINGAVVERANRSSKRFGGRVTFAAAAVRTYARYVPASVRISWIGPDGVSASWERELLAGFVANGQYCGGGMWVGRGGSMRDGLADLLLVPRLPLRRAITGSPRLFSGTLGDVKEVSRNRASSVTTIADSESRVLIDIDGEQPGVLPMEIRVLPKTLLVSAFE